MTPTVVGETVYVGSCSGTYFAVDRTTGEVRWTHDTKPEGGPAQFHGDPVVAGELIITGSDGANPPYTYAFDRASGEVRWKREGAALQSDLLLLDERVIGRTWSGDLVAMAPGDGEHLWSFRVDEYLYKVSPDESLCELDGVVYFGGADGKMYAVTATGGELIWKVDLSARLTTAPVVDDETLFVGTAEEKIVRVDPQDGRVVSALEVSGRPTGRPALTGEAVIVLVNPGALVAIDRGLSDTRWIQEAASEWSSLQPLLWGGVVIAGTRDGEVVAFDAESGEEQWRFPVEGVVRGLGTDGTTLYVGTLAGMLYAVR